MWEQWHQTLYFTIIKGCENYLYEHWLLFVFKVSIYCPTLAEKMPLGSSTIVFTFHK
jgi:hypothetical protein